MKIVIEKSVKNVVQNYIHIFQCQKLKHFFRKLSIKKLGPSYFSSITNLLLQISPSNDLYIIVMTFTFVFNVRVKKISSYKRQFISIKMANKQLI